MQKKIIIIVNVDWFFKSHRLPIALAAIEEGHQVHLACANTGHFDDFERQGIICHHIPFSRTGANPITELSTLASLYRVLRKVKPDLAHTVTIKPGIYTGLIARFQKIPSIIFAISGLGLVFSSNRFALKRWLVSRLYKFAFTQPNKRIIFQNESDKKTLLKLLDAPETDAVLIDGSGVDLSLIEPCFDIHPDRPIRIAMAARLLRDKGVYDFIAAAKQIGQTHGNEIRFLLIGAPDLENPSSVTEQEINEWKNEPNLDVLGHRSDVVEIFRSCDLVVLPSYYGEGLPKVLIEAAAAGKAVITTDNPGCKAAVIPNKTGLIVPSQSPDKLAEAILHLANSPEQLIQMGQAGRELAENKFCVRNVVEKHMASYREVMV